MLIATDGFIEQLLVSSWRQALLGRTKALIFRTHSAKALVTSIEKARGCDKPYLVNLHAQAPNSENPAYFPFLPFIKNQLQESNRSFATLKCRSEIYGSHIHLFERYFNDESLLRNEDLIVQERDFEQTKIYEAIYALLLESVNKSGVLFIIDAIDQLSPSSLGFIKWLFTNNNLANKVMFLFTFDAHSEHTPYYSSVSWETFLNDISDITEIFTMQQSSQELQHKMVTLTKPDDLSNVQRINVASDCFFLLALEECIQVGLLAYQDRFELISNQPTHYSALLSILGKAYLILEQWDDALFYFHQLESFAMKHGYSKDIILTNQQIAMIDIFKGDLGDANKYIQRSVALAEKYADKDILLLAYLPYVFCAAGGGEISEQSYQFLLKNLPESRFANHYAYFCQYSHLSASRHATIETIQDQCRTAISLHENSNNEFGLAAALHMYGVVLTYSFQAGKSIEYLKRSIALRGKFNQTAEIVQIRNGIGFADTLIEDFDDAFIEYSNALREVSKNMVTMYVSSTFFNIAMLYFITRNYHQAKAIFEKLVELIRILNIDSIPFHSAAKIHSLLGICYVKCGDIFKAIQQVTKVSSMTTPPNRAGETRYYITLLNSLLTNAAEEDTEKAVAILQTAPQYLDVEIEANKRILPQYYGELILLCHQIGNFRAVSEHYEAGLQVCKEIGFEKHAAWLNLVYKRREDVALTRLNNIEVDIEPLLQIAQREVSLSKLHKKVADINFISQIDSLLTQDLEQEEIVDQFITIIDRQFNSDAIELTITDAQETLRRREKSQQLSLSDEELSDILDKHGHHQAPYFTQPDMQEKRVSLASIPYTTSKDLTAHIILLVQGGTATLTKEDVNILAIGFTQFCHALERLNKDRAIREKSELLKSAYDELDNRHNELKQLQTQLIHHEKMSSVGTLTAGIAHEINNPLNFVFSSSQSIESQLEKLKAIILDALDSTDAEINNYFEGLFDNLFDTVGTVNEGVDRIKDIIQSLRVFSRIDEAEYKLADVNECVISTLKIVKGTYKRTVDFQLDLCESANTYCYPGQLNQAFMNFIVNSCQALEEKFGRDSGSRGLLSIKSELKEEGILISFIDNGVGMDSETQKSVFEPFFTTKAVGQGTGLGMSIAYGIIEKHSGEISIDSIVGIGTTVEVLIPVDDQGCLQGKIV